MISLVLITANYNHNGPQQFRYVSNLRGLKSSVYNGGIKVPFYLSYPKIHDVGLDLDNFSR